jgi:hypothetical protein
MMRGVMLIWIVFGEDLQLEGLAFRMLLRMYLWALVLQRIPGLQLHVQFLSQFQMEREI